MDNISSFELDKIESISDRDALDLIAECILGPDWYVVDSMNKKQSNVFLVRAIIEKYDEVNHTYVKLHWNRIINNIADKLKFKR